VTRFYVETTGESPALAQAEVAAAARALGGSVASGADDLEAVDLPDASAGPALAARLALARRCLVQVPGRTAADAAAGIGSDGRSASVRRLGRPTGGGPDPGVLEVGRSIVRAGGSIDLTDPAHRLWLRTDPEHGDRLFEEVGPTDRSEVRHRRISLLPFQRPVGLDPRLARAAANLAEIRPGDRVLDPFLGTGALLAEAGLLGARLSGIDRDPAMVRGALVNLGFLGLSADELVVGDAGEVDLGDPTVPFDAILTDPPYGRASATGGEAAAALAGRVLTRWAGRVRPGGRIVVVMPGGPDPVPPPWRRATSLPVRVHRSLTREFRVYVR
jgi:putative methyltransferase (TIGR01177 family)